MPTNCTNPPDTVPTDAGVAGTGVLLSFIITAVISLALSASLIIQEQFFRNRGRPSVVRRKLLNAYSDQQIMTGIGIQVVGLAQMDAAFMAPYHFFIIWMLSLLSMAVHNATLLALVHDFRRDWVLRWLRQFLMFVNLALSCVYGSFMLEAVQRHLTESTAPISCVWDDATPTPANDPTNIGLSFFGTIAVIAGNAVIFAMATWYLHSRAQRFYRTIQLVGLVLMAASAIGAAARVLMLSQAFGQPSVPLSDENEKHWSFGAWVSLGMLALPIISVIEILRGELRYAPPVADQDDKAELLGHSGNELHTFQPNPFWGDSSNAYKK
ncbi:hypothetical protein JX265_010771 [Neoarthrinium moseri]|uniref:Uncharacterized protein n=1 Tax=Neoarthrinium moseri TaxID=1658444 RepID=A0A9Q0ALJ4_9PEZI|nr:hypothetical protein JX265_010771 [Neoarthrinium moseri]